MNRAIVSGSRGVSVALALVLLAGCSSSPLGPDQERDLRRSIIESAQRELKEPATYPTPVVTTRQGGEDRLGISDQAMPELRRMAGPQAYDPTLTPLGSDLYGKPVRTVAISLERAVKTGVDNNLAVQFARIGPAISETQVVAAQAAFDWVLFSNATYTKTDSPRVATVTGTTTTTPRSDVSDTVSANVGLRKTLIGGGRFTVQNDYTYSDNRTPNQNFTPNPAQSSAVTLQWDQPLLRGFGSEVTLAEVRIARNAERNSIQSLKRDLISTVTDIERTYWNLVSAHRDVMILKRLQERGETVRDQLKERTRLDANQAQIADAIARVERRRADVLRAQTQLRLVSDELERLMNDPELPIGSEIVLVPADYAVDAPVKFSLLESMRLAMQNRPELQQAILSIDDASIRQTVAWNARLPELNARLQTRFESLDDNAGEAYGSVFSGEFVDYVMAVAFEMPIGNRAAEAQYRQRRLQRMQAVIAYRNTLQQVVQEVKSALDRVMLNYELIAQTRAARLAAAESLRVLGVEKEVSPQGFTVERLAVEFSRQEELAAAERNEIAAIVDYNTAIADLFAAMGTALRRNGILFIVPTQEEAEAGARNPDLTRLITPAAEGAAEGAGAASAPEGDDPAAAAGPRN